MTTSGKKRKSPAKRWTRTKKHRKPVPRTDDFDTELQDEESNTGDERQDEESNTEDERQDEESNTEDERQTTRPKMAQKHSLSYALKKGEKYGTVFYAMFASNNDSIVDRP